MVNKIRGRVYAHGSLGRDVFSIPTPSHPSITELVGGNPLKKTSGWKNPVKNPFAFS